VNSVYYAITCTQFLQKFIGQNTVWWIENVWDSDPDLDADPTPKSTIFYFSRQRHMSHNFQYYGQYSKIFWKKEQLHLVETDTDPDPDRQTWMRIRIRQNDADPTGPGSTTLQNCNT
jgi:hypothetical protein